MKRVVALAALVLLSCTALPGIGAATAAGATLRLSSITPWVEAGGSFDVHLAVGDDDLDLVVTLHPRISSRSQFTQTLEGKLLGRTTKQVTLPVADLPLDGDGDRVLSLPLPRLDAASGPTTLPSLRDGVYPVTLGLRRGSETVSRVFTHLVRLPDAAVATPLAVAVVLPLRAVPEPDGSIAPATRQAVAGAAQVVADLTGVALTLDASPHALSALGPQDLAGLRVALDRGAQLLASPWVPVDPGALVAAGRAADLATQRQVGEEALDAALDARGDPRTWSVDGTLTAPAATRLRELGVTRVVVPESSMRTLPSAATAGLTLTRPFHLAGSGVEEPLDATAAEPGLSAHFRNTGDQVLAAHELLADLAVLRLEAPGTTRGVTVRPPTTWRPDPTFLRAALPALAGVPILRTVTLDQLFEDVPPLGAPKPVVRELDAGARTTTLPAAGIAEAASSVDELASLLGTTAAAPVDAARRRLLLAEAADVPTRTRRALLANVSAGLDQVRGRIRVPDRRTFRLTAREGTIPLTITNDNPFPVHVDLELSSEKLEFREVDGPDRGRVLVRDLVVEPGALTRAVPVRARASAAFSLRARLLAPDGQELVRSRYTVISTVFSGVGIALSVAAGLFLLLWWGSHWRTVRRGRRLVDPAQ